ncbi:MAG: protein kinase, partial [Chthoniobacterales bacterium]
MGITYHAQDINLGSPVALKIISAAYAGNREARARFLREARAAAQLRHPNVARVFHFGETAAGQCFYAMELVEGETLEARVRRDGPLPPMLVLEVAIQVTRALIAAEAQGLVHRDLKPSNMMLVAGDSGDADTLVVKVIDFGLAKAVAAMPVVSGQTHAGFSGTPDFASPEQFSAGEVSLDTRSDIYSLGATLWYLLCGRTPFAGRSPGEVHAQPLPREQLAEAKTPAPMVAILRSMLAPDPVERPQSAGELLTALRRCREALEATPRRRKLLKLAALALAFAFVTIGAVGLTNYFSQRQLSATAMMAPEKSIAVLPFENLSDDKENSFFAAGVQDEILSNLARIADLKVISRTSVAQYKSGTARNLRDIGTTLGVAHLLEGSVQRVASRVRVNAQLIDARTDAHLWAQTYDRDVADVFVIQSEIASEIANQLRAQLSPAERAAFTERPTTDLTAYALYTEARANDVTVSNNWRDPDKRVELLKEAIRRDPNFVLAYCLLARMYSYLYHEHARPVAELWKQVVDTAVRLRPDLGEPHVARARYYFFLRDDARARDELTIALRLLPNDPEAIFLAARLDRHQNRWNDALAKMRKVYELDPRDGEIITVTYQTYRAMRRYAEAEQFVYQAMAKMPELTSWFQLQLAELKLAEGDPVGAQAILAQLPQELGLNMRFAAAFYQRDYNAATRIIAATPADDVDDAFGGQPPRSFADGQIARARGDNQKAQAVFLDERQKWEVKTAGIKDEVHFSYIAILDAGLGRKDDAIREAQKAVDLDPIAENAVTGPEWVHRLALVYAWTGERDRAIEQLEILAKIPNGPSYGALRFDPQWDSLRGDPRFEKIV